MSLTIDSCKKTANCGSAKISSKAAKAKRKWQHPPPLLKGHFISLVVNKNCDNLAMSARIGSKGILNNQKDFDMSVYIQYCYQ